MNARCNKYPPNAAGMICRFLKNHPGYCEGIIPDTMKVEKPQVKFEITVRNKTVELTLQDFVNIALCVETIKYKGNGICTIVQFGDVSFERID